MSEQFDVRKILEKVGAFAEGHFVYKSGRHGSVYINKDTLGKLGAFELNKVLVEVARNFFYKTRTHFEPESKVTIIGPAYGAIQYVPPVCLFLEECFASTGVMLRPGRTQLRPKSDGKGEEHYFPEKLIETYADSDEFVVMEDIVNMGSTIREVNELTLKTFGKPVKKAFCIVSRGGQTAESLGIEEFHPLADVLMPQYDPRTSDGLNIINQLGDISLKLGKGKGWVEMFGQPPYELGTDFSTYVFNDGI